MAPAAGRGTTRRLVRARRARDAEPCMPTAGGSGQEADRSRRRERGSTLAFLEFAAARSLRGDSPFGSVAEASPLPRATVARATAKFAVVGQSVFWGFVAFPPGVASPPRRPWSPGRRSIGKVSRQPCPSGAISADRHPRWHDRRNRFCSAVRSRASPPATTRACSSPLPICPIPPCSSCSSGRVQHRPRTSCTRSRASSSAR